LAFLILTENLEPSPPLRQGETYTYSIQIESLAGSGSETFSCRDTGKDEVLDIKTLQFSSAGDNQTLTCTFTVEDPGQITLILIPNGASTASHVVSSFSVNAGGSGSGPDSGNTDLGFMILMIFGVLVLTAILVAAFVLTRVVFSSTERETYDYCPACDGEIEGDEDLCPHCDFDLIKGRRQFHDCEKCEASIPDMLDHCPYCGTTQSAADRFERRERKFVEPEPEPEEEESDVEESDSDEIVAGSEDFESQVAGMGWDESQYEDEWDESLERAEQQIDDVARVRMEQMIQSLEDEDQVAETTLGKYVSAEVLDLDGIVGEKDERRHLRDEGGELSASDADIRAEIYEVTGETGVLPGDEITVDTMYDAAASVGDEIPEEIGTADFSGIDDSEPPRRRRAIRRKSSDSDDKDATDSVSSEDDAA
jgi:RNA polymerase subunit RPABC4/transcription elongation factor Spt4